MKKILDMTAELAEKAVNAVLSLIKKGVALGLSLVGGAAVAVGHQAAELTGKAVHCMSGKMKKLLAPMLKGTMIVSASVAVLSCAGWLLTRKGQ